MAKIHAFRMFAAGMIVGAVLAIGLLLMICAFAPITTTYVNPYVALSVFMVGLVLLVTVLTAFRPPKASAASADV